MDFETYAKVRPMDGRVAKNWQNIFEKKVINYLDRDSKVLDYGFGDGKYYNFFCSIFKKENIYGVEVSQKRVDRVKSKGWDKVKYVKLKHKLPYEDNFFDYINCDQVLEHIECKDAEFYLQEIKRVLKPGGMLFFVVPNYPIKRVYDFINVFRMRNISKLKDDPTHVCFYNFKSFEKTLSNFFGKVNLYPTGGGFYRLFNKNYFSHKIFAICKN